MGVIRPWARSVVSRPLPSSDEQGGLVAGFRPASTWGGGRENMVSGGGFGFGKFRLGLGWVAGTGWLGVELLGLVDGFGFGFGFCFSGFGLGWVWLG